MEWNIILYLLGTHISRAKWPSKNGKVYESIYLRQSYREGRKIKQRNIAKLTHCPPEVIAAVELALKNKGDHKALRSLKEAELAFQLGRSGRCMM